MIQLRFYDNLLMQAYKQLLIVIVMMMNLKFAHCYDELKIFL